MRVFQIQIALRGSKPKIWRRILVPENLLLSDFHKIIQTTMGWTNSHLHQFIKNRVYYAPKMEEDDFWDDSCNVDYKKMRITEILKAEKDKVTYEYDFGDSWEHDVMLEKILPYDGKLVYPTCITGKMNCPPEDCGGIWGYADMLEILKNPKHKEYKEFQNWLGVEFDPEFFDINEVNELLREKNFGCEEFY